MPKHYVGPGASAPTDEVTLSDIDAYFTRLPTTAPTTPGRAWVNNGVIYRVPSSGGPPPAPPTPANFSVVPLAQYVGGNIPLDIPVGTVIATIVPGGAATLPSQITVVPSSSGGFASDTPVGTVVAQIVETP